MRLRRPSPALVIATLALALSLGGNAWAAVIISNSSQVRDGAITGADLANGTVRSVDIGNGTIVLADLSPAAINSFLRTNSAAGGDVSGTLANLQLGADTVGSAEIASGAVATNDLANNAVGTNQIANDGVTAPDIAVNAVGASELAANAVGMSELNLIVHPVVTMTGAASVAAGLCLPRTMSAPGATIGSQTLVIDVQPAPGFVAHGQSVTTANQGRFELCNVTNVAQELNAPYGVSFITIAP